MTLLPRPSVLIIAALVLLVTAATVMFSTEDADALTYDFAVTKEVVDVHIKKDGSINIDYDINFVNYGSLDGVDIGLPNRHYNEDSATAGIWINQVQYEPAEIHRSPYVEIGLAVEFTYATQTALSGHGTPFQLRFHVNNPHMVYLNELEEGSVGILFKPTWFDPDLQRGNTNEIVVRVHFPRGFDGQDAVYVKNRPWDNLQLDEGSGLWVASWSWYNVRPENQADGDYMIGVGFPETFVDKYYEHNFWEKLGDALYSLWRLLVVCAPILFVAGIVVGIAALSWYQKKKRMEDYFEPELTVAGAPPRRDLTAVEAAIVLERPLSMVATMILFGLIKKNNIKNISGSTPMRLKILERRVLHDYERDYIAAIESDGLVDTPLLKTCLVNLVEATEAKLEGFDLEATRYYYEEICKRAWEQVQNAGTPEEFGARLDEKNDWMMLDRRYSRKLNSCADDWHVHYYPHGAMVSTGSSVDVRGMARSYTTNLRTTSSNMVTSMKSLSQSVTEVTNPPPIPTSSGGIGSSGGGCACACACACGRGES